MNIGTIISSLRKGKGYKQGEFANVVGISQTYLSLIEKNHREPNLSLLKTIAATLSIPLSAILFLSLQEEDVPAHKREFYSGLYGKMKQLIESMFLEDHD